MSIDLRTCKPGQKLRSRHGNYLTYVGCTKPGDFYHHVVRYADGSTGTRTHDGHVFFSARDPKDEDIVEIIPMETEMKSLVLGEGKYGLGFVPGHETGMPGIAIWQLPENTPTGTLLDRPPAGTDMRYIFCSTPEAACVLLSMAELIAEKHGIINTAHRYTTKRS